MVREVTQSGTGQGALFPTCPHCGSDAAPLLWALDPDAGTRTYRCRDCGGRWSADGVQATLELGPIAAGALTLTVTVVRAEPGR